MERKDIRKNRKVVNFVSSFFRKTKGIFMTTKIYAASTDELASVMEFVEGELEKYECSMKLSMQISVSVEEIFVNIAHYAYDGSDVSDRNVSISADYEDGMFSLSFEDAGIPFNPLEKDDPDITLAADERKIGGLGIFMVKKNMDEVDYKYVNNKNVFTMKKRIS